MARSWVLHLCIFNFIDQPLFRLLILSQINPINFFFYCFFRLICIRSNFLFFWNHNVVNVCYSFFVAPFLLNCVWQFNFNFIRVVNIWSRYAFFFAFSIFKDLINISLFALFIIFPFSLKPIFSVVICTCVGYVVVYCWWFELIFACCIVRHLIHWNGVI